MGKLDLLSIYDDIMYSCSDIISNTAVEGEGKETEVEEEEDESEELGDIASLSITSASTAYTLIETAHPVFGKIKRLWNSPTESHREMCAVLAAVSEVFLADL